MFWGVKTTQLIIYFESQRHGTCNCSNNFVIYINMHKHLQMSCVSIRVLPLCSIYSDVLAY